MSGSNEIMTFRPLSLCGLAVSLRGLVVRAFKCFNERTPSQLKPYQILNTSIIHSHNYDITKN